MPISDKRCNELTEMFTDATLDNALDAIEWLVHVQDFAKLDKTVEETIYALKDICGIKQDDPETKPFDKIFAMFAHAKASGLDWPKIVLGTDLNVTLAMNKNGIINITNGERYGTPSNVWYGRISPPNGTVCANLDIRGNLPDGQTDTIKNLLKAFDANPTIAAKLYGHQTGSCMFCARKLTNPQSVTVGYGPICAANYNLPHGDRKNVSRATVKEIGQMEIDV